MNLASIMPPNSKSAANTKLRSLEEIYKESTTVFINALELVAKKCKDNPRYRNSDIPIEDEIKSAILGLKQDNEFMRHIVCMYAVDFMLAGIDAFVHSIEGENKDEASREFSEYILRMVAESAAHLRKSCQHK